MPSHTISVHFRCPLLLFWLSFSCPICPLCPHLSTLIFGCLHPDMQPRSMPQPVPHRPPSQSDTAPGRFVFIARSTTIFLPSVSSPNSRLSGAVLFFAKKIPSQGIASPPTSSAETLPFSPSTACGFPSFKWMFSFKYITG